MHLIKLPENLLFIIHKNIPRLDIIGYIFGTVDYCDRMVEAIFRIRIHHGRGTTTLNVCHFQHARGARAPFSRFPATATTATISARVLRILGRFWVGHMTGQFTWTWPVATAYTTTVFLLSFACLNPFLFHCYRPINVMQFVIKSTLNQKCKHVKFSFRPVITRKLLSTVHLHALQTGSPSLLRLHNVVLMVQQLAHSSPVRVRFDEILLCCLMGRFRPFILL